MTTLIHSGFDCSSTENNKTTNKLSYFLRLCLVFFNFSAPSSSFLRSQNPFLPSASLTSLSHSFFFLSFLVSSRNLSLGAELHETHCFLLAINYLVPRELWLSITELILTPSTRSTCSVSALIGLDPAVFFFFACAVLRS